MYEMVWKARPRSGEEAFKVSSDKELILIAVMEME